MISVDYIVLIDFGHAYTKIVCWDVVKDFVFPLTVGKDSNKGIYPSIVTDQKGKFICSDFFDKPRNMKSAMDIDNFKLFVEQLFERILKYNDFLKYSKKKCEENFHVILSYPSIWEEEEGLSLLQLVREVIPPSRYAIREDIGLREIYKNLPNHDNSLVVDLGFSKTSFYSEKIDQTIYSASILAIESQMLEDTISLIEDESTNNLDKNIVSEIAEGNISKAELLIRQICEKFFLQAKNAQDSTGSDSFFLQLTEYYRNYGKIIEKSLRLLKTDGFTLSYACLIGNPNNEIIDMFKRVYPEIKIEMRDALSISISILDYFKQIYNQSLNLFEKFSSEMLKDSQYSTFNDSTCEVISDLLTRIWRDVAKKHLYDYVTRGTNTTYENFISDINSFVNNIFPSYLNNSIVEGLENDFASIIDKVVRNEFSDCDFPDFSGEFTPNESHNYLKIHALPFRYKYDNLKNNIKSALDDIYTWSNANLDYTRNENEREVAYTRMIQYISHNRIVNSVPKISWAILQSKTICKQYFIDTFCANCTTICTSLSFKQETINMDGVLSCINYAFNQIIEEGLNGLYKIDNDTIVYYNGSLVGKWDKFDFNSFVAIGNLINNRTIKANLKIQKKTEKKIKGKYGLEASIKEDAVLKDYPHIIKKLNDFFDIDISLFTLSMAPLLGKEPVSLLYDAVITKYLYFNKK